MRHIAQFGFVCIIGITTVALFSAALTAAKSAIPQGAALTTCTTAESAIKRQPVETIGRTETKTQPRFRNNWGWARSLKRFRGSFVKFDRLFFFIASGRQGPVTVAPGADSARSMIHWQHSDPH
jgi:hypothetical protein